MVNMENIQWFFPCNQSHSEDEFPRWIEEEGLVNADEMNFIDTIFFLQDDEYVHITPKTLEEARKRGARKGRLKALNQLDENTKNELRKKEILTYARGNKVLFPPSPALVPPPKEKEDPPQLIK